MSAAELAGGAVPSVRRIRREMHIGQPRAQEVRAYLAALAPGQLPLPLTERTSAS